jgi:hypothetical protein
LLIHFCVKFFGNNVQSTHLPHSYWYLCFAQSQRTGYSGC